MQKLAAVTVALGLGYVCRKLGVAVPAPPTLEGVVLIGLITLGYYLGGVR